MMHIPQRLTKIFSIKSDIGTEIHIFGMCVCLKIYDTNHFWLINM